MKKLSKDLVKDVLQLSPMQQGMLFHHLIDESDVSYHEQVVVKLNRLVDAKHFYTVIKKLVSSHDSLRTVFRWSNVKQPLQIVLNEVASTVDVIELSNVDHNSIVSLANENITIKGAEILSSCPAEILLHTLGLLTTKDRALPFDLAEPPHRFYLLNDQTTSVLLISFHHIILDGWSVGILVKELLENLQKNYSETTIFTPITTKIGMKPFLKYLKNIDAELSRSYWQQYLADSTATILGHQSSGQDKCDGQFSELNKTLNNNDSAALNLFCQSHKVTPASIVYTAWGLMLQRWTHNSDVLFGYTTSGRGVDVEHIDVAVGLFINTLPLRIMTHQQDSLLKCVKSVQSDLKSQAQWVQSSLADIQQLVLGAVKGNLFDSLVVFENYPLELNSACEGLKVTDAYVNEYTHYPLTLIVTTGECYSFGLTVRQDKLDKADAEQMLSLLLHFIDNIIHQPDCQQSKIANMTSTQQDQLLSLLNPPSQRCWPIDETVLSCFIEVVNRQPKSIALVDSNGELTYMQLLQRVEMFAKVLYQKGVGSGDLVGILTERNADTIITLMAVLYLGAAYVPLNPKSPSSRLQEIIVTCGITILVVQQPSTPFDGVTTIDYSASLSHESDVMVKLVVDVKALAYVIFSSGSTGKPKGIMVGHRSLLRLMLGQSVLKVAQAEVVLLTSAFEFDVSVYEIWSTLLNGAKLVIPRQTDLLDADVLGGLIRQHNISRAWFITPLFNSHIAAKADFFHELSRVVVGGEGLSVSHIDKAKHQYPDLDIINGYGPTENTILTTTYRIKETLGNSIPIGHATPGTLLYVLDQWGHILPPGALGELVTGGEGVALGYIQDAELSEKKFVNDPFVSGILNKENRKMYHTGDYVKCRHDFNLDYFGRRDQQLKVHGYRIEATEIERFIARFDGVKEVVVVADKQTEQARLVAFVVADKLDVMALNTYLGLHLPAYCIPVIFHLLDTLPCTFNGKTDRHALSNLAKVKKPLKSASHIGDRSELEQSIIAVWQQVLNLDNPDVNTAFFALGGTSLDTIKVKSQLEKLLDREISVVILFDYPTIRTLAQYLDHAYMDDSISLTAENDPISNKEVNKEVDQDFSIAIVGMAGQFPGAQDIEELWHLIGQNQSGCRRFSVAELLEQGVELAQLTDSNYVRVKGVIDDSEMFDGNFFGYSNRESELMDPQVRLLHQASWDVLEDAGCDATTYSGKIGMYGGILPNPNWLEVIAKNHPEGIADFEASIFNVHSVTSLVSHALKLTGPSVTVDTACSTSATAIHMACQALKQAECDMALAGGVSIEMPIYTGYQHKVGMIHSIDGVCRPFDDSASGTVTGDGVAMVALKRLEDAIADNDRIYALIKGSAVNNDGDRKIGYTAPSVSGQAEVINSCYQQAKFTAASVGLIEAHGTATEIGDPIEVASLCKVFDGVKKSSCAIGSVKGNIGHLNSASGAAGLIKAALSLYHRILPPSANFSRWNRKINTDNLPFYVNDEMKPWPNQQQPRRAGVSSFGIGGSNVHLALEEFTPAHVSVKKPKSLEIFPFSAKTREALNQNIATTAEYLKMHPEKSLQDVAFTLQSGRQSFKQHRCFYLVNDTSPVADFVLGDAGYSVDNANYDGVVMMFPGQGSQYVGMAQELYQQEVYFRHIVDECLTIGEQIVSFDLAGLFQDADKLIAPAFIKQTEVAQPLLFIVEYAIARLMQQWGIKINSMIGHSLGEYVAACLGGVFSLNDALKIVTTRGRLMQGMASGSMLSIPMAVESLTPYLAGHPSIELAGENSSMLSVVSGPNEAIDRFIDVLREDGHSASRLHTSHAFHSQSMTPMLAEFEQLLDGVSFNAPKIPFISNVSGNWITPEQATSPQYWVSQLRQPVKFASGLAELMKVPRVFAEVGPGHVLSTFAKRHSSFKNHPILATMRHVSVQESEVFRLHDTFGQLWLTGISVDWHRFNRHTPAQRISLPGYSFDKMYLGYYSERLAGGPLPPRYKQRQPYAQWLQSESWLNSPAVALTAQLLPADQYVLICSADWARGHEMKMALVSKGINCLFAAFSADAQSQQRQKGANSDTDIIIRDADDWQKLRILCAALKCSALHTYLVCTSDNEAVEQSLKHSVFACYQLASLASDKHIPLSSLHLFTHQGIAVNTSELVIPAYHALKGAIGVVGAELSDVVVSMTDVDDVDSLAGLIVSRCLSAAAPDEPRIIALRGGQRYESLLVPLKLEHRHHYKNKAQNFAANDVVWVVGCGGIGQHIAATLASQRGIKLVVSNTSEKKSVEVSKLLVEQCPSGTEIFNIGCDITDKRQIEQSIEAIIQHYGRLDGVVFAAGIAGGTVISQLSSAQLEADLSVKVLGANHLLTALAQEGLLRADFTLWLCSSTASLTGSVGQFSYAAANAWLNGFASWCVRSYGIKALSIGWDAWQTHGMAAKAVSGSEQPLLRDVVGVEDVPYIIGFQPGVAGRTYHARVSANDDWLLDQHRVNGVGTLPGTGFIELLSQSYYHLQGMHFQGDYPLEFEEIIFLAPLQVADDQVGVLFIEFTQDQQGHTFTIKSLQDLFEFSLLTHVKGRVSTFDVSEYSPLPVAVASLMVQQNGPIDVTSDGIAYGEQWQCLEAIAYDESGHCGVAKLNNAHINDMTKHHIIQPAMFDVAISFLDQLGRQPSNTIPFMYRGLRIVKRLGTDIRSQLKLTSTDNGNETYAFAIHDQHDQVVASCAQFIKRKYQPSPAQIKGLGNVRSAIPVSDNYNLKLGATGALDSLYFPPTARKFLGADEVEIEVLATGLNFKEVLYAMGLFSWPEDREFEFGLECCGIVSKVGDNVTLFTPGDDVIAILSSGFQKYAIVGQAQVAAKPVSCTYEEAATLPIAYLTAYIALIEKGRLQADEKLLIHSAAGGVGLAALNIAKRQGAVIFATAGSEEKRQFLTSAGVEWVGDSRTDDFNPQILAHTVQQGVDMVLNSLTGDLLDRGLATLAPQGRFLELGSKDISENRPLPLGVFSRGITFMPVNFNSGLANCGALLRQIVQWIDNDELEPLAHTVFNLDDIDGAFSYMAAARHIGKVVIVHRNKTAMARLNAMAAEKNRGAYASGLTGSEASRVLSRLFSADDLPANIFVSPRPITEVDHHLPISGSKTAVTTNPLRKRKRPNIGVEYRPPGHDVERELVAIFEDYLGIEGIGIDDSYVALGASSLDIVQLSSIVSRLHKGVVVTSFYNYPTIREFVAHQLKVAVPTVDKSAKATKTTKAKHKKLISKTLKKVNSKQGV